jgi:hypothetical protein
MSDYVGKFKTQHNGDGGDSYTDMTQDIHSYQDDIIEGIKLLYPEITEYAQGNGIIQCHLTFQQCFFSQKEVYEPLLETYKDKYSQEDLVVTNVTQKLIQRKTFGIQAMVDLLGIQPKFCCNIIKFEASMGSLAHHLLDMTMKFSPLDKIQCLSKNLYEVLT